MVSEISVAKVLFRPGSPKDTTSAAHFLRVALDTISILNVL